MARSRRDGYAVAGFLLALGAPAGLVAVRMLEGRVAPSLEAALAEVAADWNTYRYVAVSTAIVFAGFGYVLGLQIDRLLALSRADPLTGLLNRRAIHERASEEAARARRHGYPLSVILIDIDRLKEVNDRLGHGQGDKALGRVSSAIRDGIRAIDAAGRWGGDEFLVIAPYASADDAVRIADRIRIFSAGDTTSVSMGVAGVAGEEAVETAIARADTALYEAKRAGRNRVVSKKI